MSAERPKGRVLIAKHQDVAPGRFMLFHDTTEKPPGSEASTGDMHLVLDGRRTRAHRLFGIGIARSLIEAGKHVLFVFSDKTDTVKFPRGFPPGNDEE